VKNILILEKRHIINKNELMPTNLKKGKTYGLMVAIRKNVFL